MKKDTTQKVDKKQKVTKTTRRKFLKKAAAVSAGAVVAPTLFNIRTAKAQTTTWRIQTSWPGGIGLEIFNDWCNGIVEKTGGELAFKPFGAKAVVGEWQLFDAVKNKVLEAMNPFTLYWAGRMPVSVFFSSYPLGLRQNQEWDVFFYALGGLELAARLSCGRDAAGAGDLGAKRPARRSEPRRGHAPRHGRQHRNRRDRAGPRLVPGRGRRSR